MPRRASQPGSSAWSAAAWRASALASSERPTLSRLTASAPASSTRVRGEVTGPIASVMRSASAGRPAPASRLARRASTAAIASGSVSRSRAASWAASAPSRSRSRKKRVSARRLARWARRASLRSSSHTEATTRSTASQIAAHRVRLDEHLGAIESRQIAGGRRGVAGVDEADGQRRVVAGERQPGGPQQPLAGDLAARGDPPEGDLQDVLAAAGAVGLDDVGQLGLDAAQPQRRQPGPQHLAVERVGEPHGRPAARGDHDDEAARLERLQGGGAVDPLEVGEAEPLAHGQQLEHGAAGRLRRRPGARRPARRARRSSAAARSGPRRRRCRPARPARGRPARAR